jgi:RNA polymerase sigma-70 factor (ECF subfamily)
MNHSDQVYDQWLVMRCRDGDAAALDELLVRWQERLWRHAVRITGDNDAAWDILQESLLLISRGLGRLLDPAAFPAWAYRIATNQCRDFLRKKRARHLSMEAYLDQQTPLNRQARESLPAIDVQTALKRLSAPQQTLISLRYEEGFGVAEIAGILGIQAGTVKSRLFTARQQLRALLEDYNNESR